MRKSLKKITNKLMLIAIGAMLSAVSSLSFALTLKDDAPVTYTVKKNDTLWDIANMFLEQPWLWPELWRNNTQINNPHLIYPGDVLRIRYVDGEPVIELVREKSHIVLSPSSAKTVKPSPINMLPWDAIAPYVDQNEILDEDAYERLPHILGNQVGDIRFVTDDLVLSRKFGRAKDQYRIVRKQATIKNMDGEDLGIQIHHIADADMVEARAGDEWLVKVKQSNFEAKRGDRLFAGKFSSAKEMTLVAADDQRGFIVDNLHSRGLVGKYDIVILDLGKRDIKPGSVMGIYAQGPNIIDGDSPKYEGEGNVVRSVFDDGSTVEQPALKIGELVVFKTFDKASYGIITRASELVKRGAIVANP